jgi:hypothetical protein
MHVFILVTAFLLSPFLLGYSLLSGVYFYHIEKIGVKLKNKKPNTKGMSNTKASTTSPVRKDYAYSSFAVPLRENSSVKKSAMPKNGKGSQKT